MGHERGIQPFAESQRHTGRRPSRKLRSDAQRRRGLRSPRVRKSVPAIRNLIFVRTTPSSIRELKSRYLFLQYLTHRVDGHTEPIVVPDEQMRHFIAVASSDDEHLIYLQPEEVRFGAGDRVRVRGGVFEGVEGVFVRVKGTRDKRVVVMLEGVAAVALVTLPVQLLEAL